MSLLGAAPVLDLWEAGLHLTPAARALLLLSAAGQGHLAGGPLGQRDQALLKLYGGGGRPLVALADCPGCGATMEVVVDADRLTSAAAALQEGSDPQRVRDGQVCDGQVMVDVDGFHVVARLPTADDVAGLPDHGTVGELGALLLATCVLEASDHGSPVELSSLALLPIAVRSALEQALERADPCAEISLALSCLTCELVWSEQLDPVRFAWSAVEAGARRLATEVHTLARGYGWSEREILALSPFRRHLYLSAVES